VTRGLLERQRKKKGKIEWGENVSTGSRVEFLARVQRLTDEMLGSLEGASRGRDVDEKEARTLRSALLKSLKIWEKALHDGQRDPRLDEKLKRIENQAPQIKNGEA
jgi:hypothetical protein